MNLSPILLFVYNRPAHTRRCIESLSRNLLAVESELFIYADGAKDQTVADEVEEVRQYIRSIQGFKKVTLIERNENWGLARNIIDGVSTQVQKYGKVIVLEDDLVVAPHFLRFMNDALETYQDEPKVGHIQACEFTQDASLPDTFLIKWTGSWGWATWERAWKHFNPNGKELLQELEARKLTYTFDFNGKYGFTRMLRRQIEGKKQFLGHPLECVLVPEGHPFTQCGPFIGTKRGVRWQRNQLRRWMTLCVPPASGALACT